jgi:hypothetical protein
MDVVGFVVDIVALGQVFLTIRQFSPIDIIPPMLHTCVHYNNTFIGRTSGRSLGRPTFKKHHAVYDIEVRWS